MEPPFGAVLPGESTWSVKGDKIALEAPGRSYKLVAKIDAEAKPTKTVDLTATDRGVSLPITAPAP